VIRDPASLFDGIDDVVRSLLGLTRARLGELAAVVLSTAPDTAALSALGDARLAMRCRFFTAEQQGL